MAGSAFRFVASIASIRASRLIVVVALSIGVFAMTSFTYASKLTLTHEVYLDPKTAPVSKAIVKTNDGGLLIVGGDESHSQGWAVRTDSTGNIKWHYTAPLIDQKSDVPPRFPQFVGAVVMPDNSSFLCGKMPRPVATHDGGALLIHLDRDGKILSEQLIEPQNKQEGYGGQFATCAAWSDGIIAVAKGTRLIQNPSPPNTIEYYYWLLAFEQTGKKKWEKWIPVSSELVGSPDSISPFRIMSADKAVFVATRNGRATEIVAIDPAGNISAKNVLGEQFAAVVPVNPSSSLQLISFETDPIKLITLDDDLHEAGRLEKLQGNNGITSAYSLPDGSLMLFGSEVYGGNSYTARVVSVDSTLDNMQTLDLGPRGESYWVDAAVPLDKPGEFACVRSAINAIKMVNSAADLRSGMLGAALDFVKLNNKGDK